MNLFKKRSNISAIFICCLGVALNIFLSSIVSFFKLPLYLDTVGTVSVAMLGGYLPGVIVGFATNTIKNITDPTAVYYRVINVMIGFSAAFFAERKIHKKIPGVAAMVGTFTLLGGGVGSVIPWFVEGLAPDTEYFTGMIFGTGKISYFLSHVFSALITDFPDKLVSCILALLIVHFIPDRYKELVKFKIWLQNATEEAEDSEKEKSMSRTRVISLRTKVLFIFMFSMTVIALLYSVIGVNIHRKTVTNEEAELATGIANLAAEVIDGDRVDEYLETRGNLDDYRDTRDLLEKIFRSSEEIAFLYVYRVEAEGNRVIFDFDTEDVPAEEIGTLVPIERGFEPYLLDLLEGKKIDPIVSNDRYGYLITAAVPVYDSNYRCVCYAFADVNMEKLHMSTISFFAEMATIFLGFFILLCVFIIWLTDYQLIFPINSIARSMEKLADSRDTQEAMDEDVKTFRKLGIQTGDEIENLYLSAERLTKNQAEQMRSIRKLSESTFKMQDGLIVTMADLVESRDSDTGAHVQKTAAYVKIIVEGLKAKGYYAGKITPKFISDVVRSAPLHDIGKINIPDEVLNKPGKLTDEEYEIMKTHAAAGKRIMENAISTVEGDNYLKEARNMAGYHHERWDGKGYPEGIHGEVIPLSARIMAVADVFDALTSPRVYKPAFSLEKSLSILEEGKGTQFDPKCVEVFMESLSEVKVILRKYNRPM